MEMEIFFLVTGFNPDCYQVVMDAEQLTDHIDNELPVSIYETGCNGRAEQINTFPEIGAVKQFFHRDGYVRIKRIIPNW